MHRFIHLIFFWFICLFLTPLHVVFDEFIRKVNQGRDRLGCGYLGTRIAHVHITSHTTEPLRWVSQINAFLYFRPYSSARS